MLSKYNYWKHESIKHILITKEKIEIFSFIDINEENQYAVASLTGEWFEYIKNEFLYLKKHWVELSNDELGKFPQILDLRINVNGKPYNYSEANIKALMPIEKLESLLQGSNIYENKYVGFRELIQNAIDASLLKYWKDEIDNDLNLLSKSREELEEKYTPFTFKEDAKFHIDLYIIKTKDNHVKIRIQDRGIGITKEDAYAMSQIGTSKEKNHRLKELMSSIPSWLSPAGYFGLGIQSIFQLTNEIKYYSRTSEGTNTFVFRSMRDGRRIIEIQESVPEGILDTRGTIAEFVIDSSRYNAQKDYLYYDLEFNENNDKIDEIFQEIQMAFFDLKKNYNYNYFLIMLNVIDEKSINQSSKFSPYLFTRLHPNRYYRSDKVFGAVDKKNMDISFLKDGGAVYWDKSRNIIYRLQLHKLMIEKECQQQLEEISENQLNLTFKYYPVDKDENIMDIENGLHKYIDLDIDILDKDTSKYLNIDRKYLKHTWTETMDFRAVEDEILERWFKYLVKTGGDSLDIEYIPAFLFSIFKNKSAEELLRLIEILNCESILSLTIGKIDEEDKKLHNLLLGDLKEYVVAINTYSDKLKGFIKDGVTLSPSEGEQSVNKMEDLKSKIWIPQLPRLKEEILELSGVIFPFDFGPVYSYKNQYTTLYLTYIYKIASKEEKNEGIDSDLMSRIHDIYMPVFAEQNINLNQLFQQTFRPYQKYKKLIVKKNPKAFLSDSRSFFDNQLEGCILSPLDHEMIKLLKERFNDCVGGNSFDSYSILVNLVDINKKIEKLKKEIVDIASESLYLKKCIEFTYKNSIFLEKDYGEINAKEQIKKQYISLLKEIVDGFKFLIQFVAQDDDAWKMNFPY